MQDLSLTVVVFAPAAGAGVVLAQPLRTDLHRFRVRTTALFAAIVPLVVVLFDLIGEVSNVGEGSIPQPSIDAPWLRSFFFQLDYHLGTDGTNLLLLVAAATFFLALVLASWRQRERYRSYFALLLICETGILGTFATQDLGLFLIFFGVPLLPLALLVAFSPGERAPGAARRLLITQGLSLAALTAATLLLLLGGNQVSLNFSTLSTAKVAGGATGLVVGALLLASFLLRMGAFPCHRWLVEGISEGSTPVGMLLAVASVPVGGYGLVQVLAAIEPNGLVQLLTPLLCLALASIFYGALRSRSARDLRRVAANSLVAIGGLSMLGTALSSETSLSGALYLLFAFLFAAPLMLLVVGAICDRTQLSQLRPLAGAAAAAPRLRLFFVVAAATLVGIPLLAGFPAVFEIAVAGLASHRFFTAFALLGLLLLAASWWRVVQRVFSTPEDGAEAVELADSHGSEYYSGWVLAAALVLFGIFAGYFLPYTVQGTALVAARVSAAAPVTTHHKAK